MSPEVKVKLRHEHSKMEGPHEPLFSGHTLWLDKNGGGRGNKYAWSVVYCNIPDCKYRVIVDEFSLTAFVADLATRS
jgi:hypothetical protein